MKCLIVRAPFAGWIVDGVKHIEYRKHPIRYEGRPYRIGIVQAGTNTVIGDALVVGNDCFPAINFYGWSLHFARRYATPVSFERKKGPVVWVNVDYNPEDQTIALPLSDNQMLNEYLTCRQFEAQFLENYAKKHEETK